MADQPLPRALFPPCQDLIFLQTGATCKSWWEGGGMRGGQLCFVRGGMRERRVREAPSCGCAAVCLSCCGVAALSRGFASREHEEGEGTYSEGVEKGEGAKVRN